MNIVLLGGLWLDGEVWNDVAAALAPLGHRAVPVTLPGQGDANTSATLDDQVAATLAAVDGATGPVLVVGHSAAGTLAWMAADARPARVAAAVFIGGFPTGDGEPYADFFPITDGAMPFPGWEPFDGADAKDLDGPARERFVRRAVPVPAGVAGGVVRYHDERRFAVPVVVVCPEFSTDQAREWIDAKEAGTEIARVNSVTLVDVDTGHWPMITQPALLATVLSRVAGSL